MLSSCSGVDKNFVIKFFCSFSSADFIFSEDSNLRVDSVSGCKEDCNGNSCDIACGIFVAVNISCCGCCKG